MEKYQNEKVNAHQSSQTISKLKMTLNDTEELRKERLAKSQQQIKKMEKQLRKSANALKLMKSGISQVVPLLKTKLYPWKKITRR
eukprot:TRINITY_DN4233_c0_g1_i1.p1 TRINITY_DN4233_c0_g1~~TRINITY_DN4233_c0_g1_i1.p1  ORF type:complete len:85 (-),score=12.98 TRINITY_DN4233_c0_g1_i1:377-631(-)